MPTSPQWFLRLPEIIRELEHLSAPVIDRRGVRSAFGVRRRRAIQLMHQFGGYQVGKTFIIERVALIRELNAKRGSEEFNFEHQRKTKLIAELEQARRLAPARRVRIVTAPDVDERVVADLPGGVHLRPGELAYRVLRRLKICFAISLAVAGHL